MKPNAYLKLGTVAMDFPIMADQPLFQDLATRPTAQVNSGNMRANR
jgi:hypothetical protein